jgi:hypothetical protein
MPSAKFQRAGLSDLATNRVPTRIGDHPNSRVFFLQVRAAMHVSTGTANPVGKRFGTIERRFKESTSLMLVEVQDCWCIGVVLKKQLDVVDRAEPHVGRCWK